MSFYYNTPLSFNISQTAFRSNPAVYSPYRSEPVKDGFSTNPLYQNIGTKAQIEAEANANPRIRQIMHQYNLPIKVNSNELEKLQKGHLKDTRITTAKIYSSLPEDMKKQVNPQQLQEAAMLHDYGKILIPDNILNKNGKLNDKEREIMDLHSELGYELLKNKGLDQNTVNLVKYHHQNPQGTGYPAIENDYRYGIDSQILSTADKYTALREQRSYKDSLSREEALALIYEDVQNGLISQEVYNALVKAV